MGTRTGLLTGAMLFCQFSLATGQGKSYASPLRGVRTVARDTLADLAIAVADPADPVIYYNPRLLERFGPEIAAFVLAHEEAHIKLGHRRPENGPRGQTLEALLQGWELHADCAAAVELSRTRPAALLAAIDLFQKQGATSVDREHPTGSVRAANLSLCGGLGNGGLHQNSEGPRSFSPMSPIR